MIIKIEKYNKILVLWLLLAFIFIINVSMKFSNFLDFSYEEIHKDEVQVINIYKKQYFNVLKLKADDYEFFTSTPKDFEVDKLNYLTILFISKNITFIEYLKGFYTKSIYVEKIDTKSYKYKLLKKIDDMHDNKEISELFNALFFAIPTDNKLREVFTNYSISHLIALSGFHIALLSFIIYSLFKYPYSLIHQKYFPFRNKKSDLMVFTLIVIFAYLVFTGFVPSLLRAFVMVVIGFILLKSNLKLISYETLTYTFLIVITLFPNYIFSIGFWFSIIAVFYIFLYIQYFSSINKYLQLVFFNFWIFLVFNPIVHFFFTQTSYEQLLSPFITIVFTLFYPFEIIAHIFSFETILDEYILEFINYEIFVFEVSTPLWFFVSFILISLLSVKSKRAFYLLNSLTIGFNIYLYYT